MGIKKCNWCNEWYTPNRADQKWCSYECRLAVFEPRKKVEAKARYAVKSGKITRKPCEVCGKKKVHGHHTDYSKPYDVIWLCPKHHAEAHKK